MKNKKNNILFISNKKNVFNEFKNNLSKLKYLGIVFSKKNELNFLRKNNDYRHILLELIEMEKSSYKEIETIFKNGIHNKSHIVAVIKPHDIQNNTLLQWLKNGYIHTLLFYPFLEDEIINKLNLFFVNNENDLSESSVTAGESWFQNLFFLDQIFSDLQDNDIFNITILFERFIEFCFNNIKCDDLLIAEIEKPEVKVYHNNFSDYNLIEFNTFSGIDEIARILSYEEPVIQNNVSPNIKLTEVISQLTGNVKHLLLFPLKLSDQKNYIWILSRKSDKPFKEFEFIWTQSILKLIHLISRYINFIHSESAKWNRLKVIKRKITSLQKIFDAFQFGVVVVDMDFTIRLANSSLKSILGIDKEYLEGEPLATIVEKDKFALIEKAISLKNNEYRGEFEFSGASKSKKQIGFSVYPKIEIDDDIFIVILFKDISEEKEIQQELIKMDRLSTLGIMASEIAHEIRNPLAGISAVSEAMKDEIEKNSPIFEYVDRIIKQTKRIEKLLKSMFNYAKPQRPHLEIVDFEKVLDETSILLKERMKNKQIHFSYFIHGGAKYMFVDPGQFQQILLNIILNSIDAIGMNGNIKLIARPQLELSPKLKKLLPDTAEEKFVLISIEDDGSGIKEEYLSKLFLPFFTTKSHGTGLGLSIVYQLIKEHGGHIYFEPNDKKGTTCNIIIPKRDTSSEVKI